MREAEFERSTRGELRRNGGAEAAIVVVEKALKFHGRFVEDIRRKGSAEVGAFGVFAQGLAERGGFARKAVAVVFPTIQNPGESRTRAGAFEFDVVVERH